MTNFHPTKVVGSSSETHFQVGVSVSILRGSTHYWAFGPRGISQRRAAYEDCSSLALNAVGEDASFTLHFKMFQSFTVLL